MFVRRAEVGQAPDVAIGAEFVQETLQLLPGDPTAFHGHASVLESEFPAFSAETEQLKQFLCTQFAPEART